jgi:hypothetical protein
VSSLWAQLLGPKVMGLLGLGCLGFGGLMLALYFSGQKPPPAPQRAALQEVRGRVVVVTARDSGIYSHSNSRMRNALAGWQVLLDPGGNAEPVTLHVGDWPPFGSSRSLDLARVESLLPKGTLVRAYVHEGPLVWHLEREGRVLVDFDERLADYERRAALDVWLMVLLPLIGLLMCGRAVFAWLHEPPGDDGELRQRGSTEGKA